MVAVIKLKGLYGTSSRNVAVESTGNSKVCSEGDDWGGRYNGLGFDPMIDG